MIKYIRTITAILLSFPCTIIYAQTDAQLNKTLSGLQSQATVLPIEKVYLHLDRSYYTSGDTIWFKAYCVTGPLHQLSSISHVLNVELINGSNKIIKAIKLAMPNGITNGDIILPDSLKEGNYRVRAYTNWMRNYNAAYFYNNTIKIANAVVNRVFTKATYSYGYQNNVPTVTAHISYINLNGDPYTSSEVKYKVMQNKTAITSGSGLTDNSGNINITLNGMQKSLGPLNLVTTVQLSGTPVTKEFTLTSAVDIPDVQFFPEGGSIINGVPAKIAFKAIGPNGLGTDIKGTLTDNENNVITVFNSTHLGMGVLTFTPQQGRTYKAKIDFADGRTDVVDMPKAADKGYILNIDNSADATVDVKILAVNEPGDVTLIAQAGNTIFFAGKSTPGKPMFTASIPKNKFPTSIVQFTLFSATGEPLNERLVFMQNHDQLKLNIQTDKNTYATHEKVNVNLSTNSPGNFSAAVINETLLPVDENAETTILSSLLLTSDLTGYIEKPNYYFVNDNGHAQADLDVLMLTQGFHKFEWAQLATNTPKPPIYRPENDLTISGRLLDPNNKPVVGGKVSLFSVKGGNILDTLTNNEGQFVFDNINFKDSTQITIRATTAKNSNKVKIRLDEPPAPTQFLNSEDAIVDNTPDDATRVHYLKSAKKAYDEKLKLGLADGAGIMLNEVNIKSAREKTIESIKKNAIQYSSNLNGPGNANQVLYSDNLFFGCPTFRDCMDGRLIGVEWSGSGNPVSTRTRSSLQSSPAKDPDKVNEAMAGPTDMAVIYDGMFVPPDQVAQFLSDLKMANVATVEVLRSIQYLAIYGSRGGNGILIITSKHGLDFNIDLDDPKYVSPYTGFINIMPTGYYKARRFYSPRYSPNIPAPPDLRSTVYWSPLIQTDNTGKTSFEYFNTDSQGNYRVVVEGIDSAGHIGRQVYHYKVE